MWTVLIVQKIQVSESMSALAYVMGGEFFGPSCRILIRFTTADLQDHTLSLEDLVTSLPQLMRSLGKAGINPENQISIINPGEITHVTVQFIHLEETAMAPKLSHS